MTLDSFFEELSAELVRDIRVRLGESYARTYSAHLEQTLRSLSRGVLECVAKEIEPSFAGRFTDENGVPFSDIGAGIARSIRASIPAEPVGPV